MHELNGADTVLERSKWVKQLIQYSLLQYHKACFYLHYMGYNSSNLELDDPDSFFDGYEVSGYNTSDLYLGYECKKAETWLDFEYLYQAYRHPELKAYSIALLCRDIIRYGRDVSLNNIIRRKELSYLDYLYAGYDRFLYKNIFPLSHKILLCISGKVDLKENSKGGFIFDDLGADIDDTLITQYIEGKINPINQNSKKLLDFLDKEPNRKWLDDRIMFFKREYTKRQYQVYVPDRLTVGYSFSGNLSLLPERGRPNFRVDFDNRFMHLLGQTSFTNEFMAEINDWYEPVDYFTGRCIPELYEKGYNGEFITLDEIREHGLSIEGADVNGYYPLISVGGL